MPTLASQLAFLDSRGFVRIASERDKPLVRFKHALVREATYQSMLQSRRAELHRAAAETLSALYKQPDQEMVLTIAEHWQRGNEDARTLETILPHAQNLIYTGRSISVTALLERVARENLNDAQQRDLDITLADAHAARGEYEMARALYERALPRAATLSQRANLLQRIGAADYQLGNYARAIQQQQASLELAAQANDIAAQARAMDGLGLAYWHHGDQTNAVTFLEHSRRLSLELGDTLQLANAEFNLAGILMEQGKYLAAIEAAERALALDEQLGHPTLAARTLSLLGACYFSLQAFDKASVYYERALTASRTHGDMLGAALAQANLAELYMQQQEYGAAAKAISDAVRQFRLLKHDFLLSGALALAAQTQLHIAAQANESVTRRTLFDDARARATEALEIGERLSSAERTGVAQRVLAEIFAAQDDLETAQQHAQRAVAVLEQSGSALELKLACETLGKLLARSPDSAQRAQGHAYLHRAAQGG